MKKTMIFLIAAVISLPVLAQVNTSPNPYPKTITVTGSAAMDVVPDQIFVNVELKEYQKKNEPKKDIESIKAQFLESCHQSGIADSSISIVSFTGSGNYYFWRKKKKDADLYSGITYQIKFRTSGMMDLLVDKLDDDATQSFQIVRTDHSRMAEFRRQLKIKAVQAAKEKGIYLTEAIGEKLGEAITINEPQDPSTFDASQQLYNGLAYSQSNNAMSSSPKDFMRTPTEIDFKTIRLRFEVEIVFALK